MSSNSQSGDYMVIMAAAKTMEAVAEDIEENGMTENHYSLLKEGMEAFKDIAEAKKNEAEAKKNEAEAKKNEAEAKKNEAAAGFVHAAQQLINESDRELAHKALNFLNSVGGNE